MKIGDDYPVWWFTGRKTADGAWNLAYILEIRPYRGRYPQWFTHVLRLTADTKKGWVEMAV